MRQEDSRRPVWEFADRVFLGKGFRVIARDRRGHGRSTQTSGGHDMDHYADDLAALTAHLDLKNAIHVGQSSMPATLRPNASGHDSL